MKIGSLKTLLRKDFPISRFISKISWTKSKKPYLKILRKCTHDNNSFIVRFPKNKCTSSYSYLIIKISFFILILVNCFYLAKLGKESSSETSWTLWWEFLPWFSWERLMLCEFQRNWREWESNLPPW